MDNPNSWYFPICLKLETAITILDLVHTHKPLPTLHINKGCETDGMMILCRDKKKIVIAKKCSTQAGISFAAKQHLRTFQQKEGSRTKNIDFNDRALRRQMSRWRRPQRGQHMSSQWSGQPVNKITGFVVRLMAIVTMVTGYEVIVFLSLSSL